MWYVGVMVGFVVAGGYDVRVVLEVSITHLAQLCACQESLHLCRARRGQNHFDNRMNNMSTKNINSKHASTVAALLIIVFLVSNIIYGHTLYTQPQCETVRRTIQADGLAVG